MIPSPRKSINNTPGKHMSTPQNLGGMSPSLHLPQSPRDPRSEFEPEAVTSSSPVTPRDRGEGPEERWPPTRLGLCRVWVPRKGPQKSSGGGFPSYFSCGRPTPFSVRSRGLFDLWSDKERSEGQRLRSPAAGLLLPPPPAGTRGASRPWLTPEIPGIRLEAACQTQQGPPNILLLCSPGELPKHTHSDTSFSPSPAFTDTQTHTGSLARRQAHRET